jgi:hypothetical protein
MPEATYRIESVPIASFIDETSLQLPAFQRKSTWKERQRFNLAIAVYRQYPPGYVVVKETKAGTILLDGRQRWETFIGLRDPHLLWEWARRAIPLRVNVRRLRLGMESNATRQAGPARPSRRVCRQGSSTASPAPPRRWLV